MQNDHCQDKRDDDLQLDDRRGQVHPSRLIGPVIAVPSEEEMQQADRRHPGGRPRRELRETSDFARQDGGQQKQRHPDRDCNSHALTRRARDDATPDGGIVEGKSPRRQDGQDGAQHFGSLSPIPGRQSCRGRHMAGLPSSIRYRIRRECRRYFFTFSGSLTSSNFANSVFQSSPFIFSTLRM